MIPSHPRGLADWLSAGAMAGAVLVVIGLAGWILIDLLSSGLRHVDVAFFTEPVRDAGRAGGIGPLLVSTLLILAASLAIALPIGLGAAVFLSELTPEGSRTASVHRRALDVLAAVPSIVFGLFGMAFFADFLGLGFSILAGGFTLAAMILPTFIRLTERGLGDVPASVREAAWALGLSRSTMLARIALPTAAPAIGGALAIAMGRALSETAVLIFTAGYVTRWPESWLDSGRSLSVHVYDLAMNVPGGEARGQATGAVLVLLIVILNGVAAFLVGLAGRRITNSETS